MTQESHQEVHQQLTALQGDRSDDSWYYWPYDTEDFLEYLKSRHIKGMPDCVRIELLKKGNK